MIFSSRATDDDYTTVFTGWVVLPMTAKWIFLCIILFIAQMISSLILNTSMLCSLEARGRKWFPVVTLGRHARAFLYFHGMILLKHIINCLFQPDELHLCRCRCLLMRCAIISDMTQKYYQSSFSSDSRENIHTTANDVSSGLGCTLPEIN